jgi:hypothetical protein
MTPESKRASRGQHGHRDDGGIIGVIPYVVVLLCVVAGWYIAWSQGSGDGGRGAVVAGIALLVAALIRLGLPARLAGLLGTRKRATDVITLAVIGVALIVAGLIVPRLPGRTAGGVSLRRPRKVS